MVTSPMVMRPEIRDLKLVQARRKVLFRSRSARSAPDGFAALLRNGQCHAARDGTIGFYHVFQRRSLT